MSPGLNALFRRACNAQAALRASRPALCEPPAPRTAHSLVPDLGTRCQSFARQRRREAHLQRTAHYCRPTRNKRDQDGGRNGERSGRRTAQERRKVLQHIQYIAAYPRRMPPWPARCDKGEKGVKYQHTLLSSNLRYWQLLFSGLLNILTNRRLWHSFSCLIIRI